LDNSDKFEHFDFYDAFCRQCIAKGFRATGAVLAKSDGGSLCLVFIGNFDEEHQMEWATAVSQSYGSAYVVHISTGDSPSEGEAYHGQSPYLIKWRVDPDNQIVHVPEGQPDDVMGLKTIIQAAFNSESTEGVSPTSLPYGESPETHIKANIPICTFALAFTNIAMMVLMYWWGYAHNPIGVAAQFGAIIPARIWEYGEFYRLFMAMFIHFGWSHLFFNLVGMLIFGTRIERYYGKLPFLLTYIVTGLIASVTSLLLTQGFSAGASGAVYGLVGSAFVYTRRQPMDIINKHVMLIYIIFGLGMGFVMPNIDYFGHIGGLISGILAGYIVLKAGNLSESKV